jgi:hypothetical protein
VSITPKNWDSFQHYKDRSPIWIKLHRKLLDDYAFSRLPVASRALAPMLWLLASEYNDGKITAPNDEIAFRLHMTGDELLEALNPLINAGFFVSDSKLLARRKRVAMPETETETQVKTEKNIGRSAAPTRPSDEAFETFKKAYPKRKGPNPWPPARKLFDAAVKRGVEIAEIVDGARRFAAQVHDKIGTEFIPHARTWLHGECWKDYQGQPPPTDGVVVSHDEKQKILNELRGDNGLVNREGTSLREGRIGTRAIDGTRRGGPADTADDPTKNPGMGGVENLFHESSGVRAGGDEASSDGPRPILHGPRAMAS